jgi:AbrB family looped-hinge helix DNA binding protein
MTVTMSTKGQIVVPKEIRERAGMDAGDELEISLEDGKVQLKKAGQPARQRLKIKINKSSGMPYFDAPKDAPPITLDWIKEQTANFP